MHDAAKRVNPDILVLCHGGPIAEPDDAAYVLANTEGVVNKKAALDRIMESGSIVARQLARVAQQTVTALNNLEAICAVDGVDGVFIGPADLAASMGHRGKPGHPEVQAAIEQAMKTIIASGKAAGTLTSDPALARRYLALGCTFVATGVDVLVYANAIRRMASDFKSPGAAPPAGPSVAY